MGGGNTTCIPGTTQIPMDHVINFWVQRKQHQTISIQFIIVL